MQLAEDEGNMCIEKETLTGPLAIRSKAIRGRRYAISNQSFSQQRGELPNKLPTENDFMSRFGNGLDLRVL
jgi:hypothetical protein